MNSALLVDIGNTTATWRLLHGGQWAARPVRVPAPDAPDTLTRAAADAGTDRAICVSSAPAVLRAVEEALAAAGVTLALAERDFAVPIETAYYDRRQIGPDRLCNALAARELLGAPCISCSVGTCITVEAVDDGGVLVGGAIAAGLPAARAGVETTAAHLSPALSEALQSPPTSLAPGRSTTENLRLGLWLQAAATVDRLIAAARSAIGEAAPAVLTGGDAPAVATLCRERYRTEPFLTLEGLRLAYLAAT